MNTYTKEIKFGIARKAVAALAIFGFLSLGVSGQEAKQGDKAGGAPAPGLLLEWTGEARIGNPYDEPSKDGKHVVPVVYSRLDDKTHEKYKKIMGGSVYFAVFKNMGALAKDGDTFGTGMKGFDKKFSGGDGVQFSPGFDTSANYLYLYQVVNARCLDGRNFLADPVAQKERPTEKDVIKDFKRVSPPTEAIARWALTLSVRPRDISSWGYFSGTSFVAHETASLNLFAEETKVATMIKPISFLPSMLKETPNPIYKNRAPAQSLGALQSTFHVGSSTANLDKSPAYPGNDNAVKFALKADAQDKFKPGEIPFSAALTSAFDEKAKKFRFDVNPSSVQIMHDAHNDVLRGEMGGLQLDEDLVRSVLLVKFDEDQGLKNGQFSVVFGFTSNLPPRPERVRLDTEESVRQSRPSEKRPADLFSSHQVDAAEGISATTLLAAAGKKDGLPALKAFSRETAGVGEPGSLRTAGETFVADGVIRVAGPNEPRQIPGPAVGFYGATAIVGGFSTTGLGGLSGGCCGGGILPGFAGIGGGGISGGGFGAGGGGLGGGTGGNNGNNGQQQQPNTQSGNQTINFAVTLINQQQQKQKQSQLQDQHQGQHQGNHHHNHHGDPGHGDHNHGAVVPAPASLLLGLLGLPALFLLRRRKTELASETQEPIA
jgi:hypothetical protein